MRVSTDLKKIRENKGFTQAQIAELAHITVMSYSRYESGQREPRARTAIRIARVLNTTVEKLFPIPERQFGDIEEKPDGNRAK